MPDRRVAPMHDVAIVGAGPAGLHAAALLARRGWDVAVFEEHAEPGEPVHCTGVLAAEAYDELDIPREPVLNALSHVRFFAPSGEEISYSTEEAEALVIDRRLFDFHMGRKAAASGVAVFTGARVTEVSAGTGGVVLSRGAAPPVRARACILACGANYVLQRRLGFGMPAVFLHSAQLELPASGIDAVEVHFGREVAPNGFAWVVPVRRRSGETARIGLMCEGQADRFFRRFVERISSRCGVDRRVASRPRLKMLPLAPVAKTYADRILAVGDAAGLVKATTGGGIYYSLVSAQLAADLLDDALRRGRLGERDLAPYERAWRKRLGPELDAQLALRRAAHRFTDADIDGLFDLARTDGLMPIVRRTARFNRHRELITALFRHPPARRVLFRRARRGAVAPGAPAARS